jgi:hypothetical protein
MRSPPISQHTGGNTMAAKPARAVPPYLSSICWQCGRQASPYSESGYLSAASASHVRSVIRTSSRPRLPLPPERTLSRDKLASPWLTRPAITGQARKRVRTRASAWKPQHPFSVGIVWPKRVGGANAGRASSIACRELSSTRRGTLAPSGDDARCRCPAEDTRNRCGL